MERALLSDGARVEIKLTSSLTAEDENRVAAELLRVVSAFLDATPIAYALRIETCDGRIYRRSRPQALTEQRTDAETADTQAGDDSSA